MENEPKLYIKTVRSILGTMVYSYREPHKKSKIVGRNSYLPFPCHRGMTNLPFENKLWKIYEIGKETVKVTFVFEFELSNPNQIKVSGIIGENGELISDFRKIHPDILSFCQWGEYFELEDVQDLMIGNKIISDVEIRWMVYE